MAAMSGFIQEGADLPSINPKFKYSKMALFRTRSEASAILRRSKSLTEPQMRNRVRSCGDPDDTLTTSNSFQGVPSNELGKVKCVTMVTRGQKFFESGASQSCADTARGHQISDMDRCCKFHVES